jgi:hypothetical protein
MHKSINAYNATVIFDGKPFTAVPQLLEVRMAGSAVELSEEG